MAAPLERSASSVRDNMAAFQRSASAVKMESTAPILQRTNSMIKGGSPPATSDSKLKEASLPSVCTTTSGIKNRNILIGLLSTLLVLSLSWQSFGPDFVPAGSGTTTALATTGKWSHGSRALPYQHFVQKSFIGGMKFLVQSPKIDLNYHNGPLMVGKAGVLRVHLIFYGVWSAPQKLIITDFIKSFSGPKGTRTSPTVAGWWATTRGYKDRYKVPVAQTVLLGSVHEDNKYTYTKQLKEADVEKLVTSSVSYLKKLPLDPSAIYVVLTSADVNVQGFCSSLCGTHLYTRSPATQNKILPYAWVGNSARGCPGHCAWPYAKPAPGAGPDVPPLKAPNGDVGIDGMCINLASLIAGTATNPLGNGYYQGVETDPLEATGVCGGIYGYGAYPGYAGQLRKDKVGASFNVHGVNNRGFLVPFMFDTVSRNCVLQL